MGRDKTIVTLVYLAIPVTLVLLYIFVLHPVITECHTERWSHCIHRIMEN